MKNKYTLSEIIRNLMSLFITRIFYKKARLIRRPFYIRGRSSLGEHEGLTTGYNCRFDLEGSKNKTLHFGKNCRIGDNVHIVALNHVELGDDVLIASKVFISDSNHGDYKGEMHSNPSIPPNDRKITSNKVIIESNVWIGENVCVLSGVTIGHGSIIGANAVVTRDIPDNCIAIGAPAKVIKKYSQVNKKWNKFSEDIII